MSKTETTVMLTVEIILIGEESGEIAAGVTEGQIADIIKRRLDADHVLITSKKVFVREEV